jgi:diadenosine tetraphosphatase ApaH/serine/threonine PP2A family protein phosphatase
VPKIFVGGDSAPPKRVSDLVFQFDPKGRALVNPGSVGQPRSGDPRAKFVVFNPEELTVEFANVEYNIEGAARAIIEAGLPPFLAERLYVGM